MRDFVSVFDGSAFAGEIPDVITDLERVDVGLDALYLENLVTKEHPAWETALERWMWGQGYVPDKRELLHKAEQWEETEHPREKYGKFTEGPGGDGEVLRPTSKPAGAPKEKVRMAGRPPSEDERAKIYKQPYKKWPVEKALSQHLYDSRWKKGDFTMEDMSKEWKATVAKDIAQRTKIPMKTTNLLIKAWAHSSNDGDPMSLSIQQAAAEELGGTISNWQKDKIDNLPVLEKLAAESTELHAAWDEWLDNSTIKGVKVHPGSPDGIKFNRKLIDEMTRVHVEYTAAGGIYGEKDYHKVVSDLNKIKDKLKPYVRGVYDATQEKLASLGYKPDDEIMLYRGIELDKAPFVGSHTTYEGNAIESWTTEPTTAHAFGHTVLACKVKVKDVVSMPTTGMGCLNESEIIIKSGKMKALVAESYK